MGRNSGGILLKDESAVGLGWSGIFFCFWLKKLTLIVETGKVKRIDVQLQPV
jgi:hypothetical protein